MRDVGKGKILSDVMKNMGYWNFGDPLGSITQHVVGLLFDWWDSSQKFHPSNRGGSKGTAYPTECNILSLVKEL